MAQAFIPHVTITNAVGASIQQNDRAFDDLVHAGGWPVSLNIHRIERIEVFATDSEVRGIRITYVATPPHESVLHGHATGTSHVVAFDNENIIPVGVFGGRNANGLITSIGFVSFDTRSSANPPVRVFGPFGSTSPPQATFGTYGHLIALIGTDNNTSGLRSLGFVKSDSLRPGLL